MSMDFGEEFKKLAEEKGMTYPELAKKIIDMVTDEESCMSCRKYIGNTYTLNEAHPETNDKQRVLGYDLSMGDDMTHFEKGGIKE